MRRVVEVALTAMLLAGPVHATDWPDVPVPEGSSGQWVTRHMINNGLHMRVSRHRMQADPQALVGFYRRQWPSEVVVNEVGSKTIVGHAQGDHFITIEISRDGAGSEAQIGIMKMPKEKPRQPLGAGFLKPAGAQVLNDIQYLDNPGRTLSLQTALSPQQSEAFYRSRLPGQGWKLERSQPCGSAATSCIASYTKADQQMQLVFNRGSGGTSIVANQIQQ